MSSKKSHGGLDLLAFAAHPDDAELSVGGTLAKLSRLGRRVGIADATRGEMGTRGDVATRSREAGRAARVLGLSARVNLGLPDGGIGSEPRAIYQLVDCLRALKPLVVVAPYWESRHPDHVALSRLAREACFFAGLARWPSQYPAWKPRKFLYSLAYASARPSFFVDVSEAFRTKLRAIAAHASQIRGVDRLGDVFPAGRPLLETIEMIHAGYGAQVQVRFAEPFLQKEPMLVEDPVLLPLLSI